MNQNQNKQENKETQFNKLEKKENEYTIEKLFESLVLIYYGQVRRKNFYDGKAYDDIYRTALREITKRQEADPSKADYYAEMLEVLNKFYKLMTSEEVGREIIEKKIKIPEFIRMHRESILGKNKRIYDMSKLFNPDYIATINDEEGKKERKALAFEERVVPLEDIVDDRGQRITIEQCGILHTKHWNNIHSYITKYKITRITAENEYIVNEVYSNINISQLANSKYREAIIQELLSSNNISLSNTKGYVGEIVKTPPEMESLPVGSEIMESSGTYIYKVNDRYSLCYDATDLSAVMLYEPQSREENSRTDSQKTIPEIEDETR